MSSTQPGASPSATSFWPGVGGLILLAAVIPAVVVLLFAASGSVLALAAVAVGVAVVFSIRDLRVAVLLAVLFASFATEGAGMQTKDLSILLAWMTFIAILIWWRSSWKGWRSLPREVLPGFLAWMAVVAMGTIQGVLRGNSVRYGGLELFAACWPIAAYFMSQVFGRRSIPVAVAGLSIIALCHTGFGLVMLKVIGQRVGGVYFTPVTGLVAVILWTTALLTSSRWLQLVCLAIIVPLLLHLFFSFTRGYWLGYMAGLTVTSVLAWRMLRHLGRRAQLSRIKVAAGFLAGLLLVSWLAVSYLGESTIFQSAGRRFGSSFQTQATGETASNIFRLVEYEEVIRCGIQSPIIGWGFGYTIDFRDPIFRTHEDHWFIHNYYLLTWLKLGVVGLLVFLFFILQTLRLAWQMMMRENDLWVKIWAIATIGVTVDLLVISFTHYPLAGVNSGFVLALVWGVLWGIRGESTEWRRSEGPVPYPAGS